MFHTDMNERPTPMNATLRFNEALLITGRAFQPYQCVAWSELAVTAA